MAVDGHYENIELQEVDDIIYDDIDISRPTAQERDPQKILQSDIRRYMVVVGVGLLCAVLALLNVAVPLYLYQSNMVDRHQLVTSYDQLQTSFDQLMTRHNNLTEQNGGLLSSHDKLETRHDQLETRHDQLKTRYGLLTEERDRLQIKNNNLTEERDDMKWRLCESPGWQSFDRGCYYISTERKTWEESRQWCRDRQSDLIVIKSKEKQDFVERLDQTVWLGLTDREEEGLFTWVDGTPLNTPTYWEPDQPNNAAVQYYTEQDCVEFFVDNNSAPPERGWNDRSCFVANNWICERLIC